MTPEEIFADLDATNREALSKLGPSPTAEELVVLMNAAGMHGFRLGGQMALSMVKGALAVKLAQIVK